VTSVAATLYDWLKFLHILAAMIWLGGLVALGLLATQALRRRDRDSIVRLVGNLRMIGPLVFAPAMAAVVGFGIWLVLDSAAWDFGQTWIGLALGLFAVAFLTLPSRLPSCSPTWSAVTSARRSDERSADVDRRPASRPLA